MHYWRNQYIYILFVKLSLCLNASFYLKSSYLQYVVSLAGMNPRAHKHILEDCLTSC